jgi:fructokinase
LLTPSLARATARFLELVRANDGLVFVDLNVRTHLWPNQHHMRRTIAGLVRIANVVKASDADLAALGGRRSTHWLDTHAPGATRILTRGDRGAVAEGEHGRVAAPALRARTVDATGAGDAFTAGVLAALVEADARPGRKIWTDASLWMRAIQAGNLMGAKAVGCVGAVTGLTNLARVRRLTAGRGSASPDGT